MNRSLLRSIALAAPAILLYAVAIPALAPLIDRRLGADWPFPEPLSWLAVVLLPLGLAVAFWSFWHLTIRGEGTPNPIRPPMKLVVRGPYRWSRNPMMVGGWVFGAGLALALRSLSLLVAYLVIAVIGIVYVRKVEEPRMLERFGEAYRSYAARVPRWLLLLAAFVVGG